jgi:site-specific DNA-methyltransferase (adenine-specific)
MGMKWDRDVPPVETWIHIARALKPGSPLLAFGGTRTHHRLMCSIEDAGFILADTICWLYGQGFPKGRTRLKPAWEPIILAFTPGKQRLNIEAARIPASDSSYARNCSGDRGHAANRNRQSDYSLGCGSASDAGRWPSNLILDEQSARALDSQSGILTSGANPARRKADKFRQVYAGFRGHSCFPQRGVDRGGASRFFYCAKASQRERGNGNTHPTVKPLKLLEYLAGLILLPGERRLLVPFSGSGSEVIAARRAGWAEVIGIEKERSYVAISRRRLKAELTTAHETSAPPQRSEEARGSKL